MNTYPSVITVVAVMTAVSGCAGTNFRWEDTEKVKQGMTEEEVIAILGKPYSRVQFENRTRLVWTYATLIGGARAVAYTFVDGKMVVASMVNK